MENETKLAIFLFVLSGLVILGAVVYVQAARLSASPILPDSCEVLAQGSGEINVLFMGEKKTAERYADYISSVSPFDEFNDKASYYYLNYKPECTLYKGIAILCDSADLHIAAASCPHDYIIISESRERSVRSSTKGNIISINSNLPDSVIIHELGHAVAHLAEEYINNQNPPSDSKNCASLCSNFGDSGCFTGCSQTFLSRSIENGVMKTLDNDNYGDFDASLIRKKLSSFSSSSLLSGLATSPLTDCADRSYVLVSGRQNNGKIEVSSTELRDGCAPNSGTGSDSYSIVYPESKSDSVQVSLSEVFTDGLDGEDLSGEIVQDQEFSLAIPVTNHAESIDLSSGTSLVNIPIPEQGGNLLCKI